MEQGEKYTKHFGKYPVISLSLKTNPFLEFSVITGCLRISKESIFTGLNNLEIISILKDDNLWSFLLFTGYLKKVSKRQEGENIYVKMAIPNSEVRYIYKNMIIEWFNNKIKQKDFSKMYEGMFKGDEITFEEELVSVLEETISFNDAYENFYHGFLVEVLSNIDNYEIKSNRESGIGRSDIIIKYPNRRGKAVIIEIKVSQNVNDLENKCYEALN